MKTVAEIAGRIKELKANALLIDQQLNAELEKKLDKRDYRLLKFLNREQVAWNSAIQQLEWLLE